MSQGSVLVIKLGALGDVVQALGPFAAIRAHHADARLTLLTTPPFAPLAQASPYFDAVWTDIRPKFHQVRGVLDLRRRLRAGRFQRVYDLQTSSRSGFYFRLFRPGPVPEWVGIARGCSHPHANPNRDFMHTLDRQAEQLAVAGIAAVPPPDLTWANGDAARFGLAGPFAVLVPGGAAHRPEKRWPAERFAEVARRLAGHGVQPVLVGAASERDLHDRIRAGCPAAIGLAGETALTDLAALSRSAAVAIGNDTGPMHLAAAAGCPSVVLFSLASDPALCGQRGPCVRHLRRPRLTQIPVDDVVTEALAVMHHRVATTAGRDRDQALGAAGAAVS